MVLPAPTAGCMHREAVLGNSFCTSTFTIAVRRPLTFSLYFRSAVGKEHDAFVDDLS